ncbi:hypothetical protein IMZ38_01775 [Thermosphaera chiliense]|uniref:Uncharacterized protein n=1 Tax=Thermosphaera chiliense TaxID=3402707 RepID=A0A7M1URU1_9CREN|nr:hypothetical protein [Thermosphaera aggregans]QOR94689.1 hypothetical protein IMZ38_01775 [Thermosphaera aggregans]
MEKSLSRISARGLEEGFLDFLTTLASFESTGLRIMDLFEHSASRRIRVPGDYASLARLYVFLEKASGDPYTSLRSLAELTPSPTVSRLLREYGEVLVSTGGTMSLVEKYLSEELEKHWARVSSLFTHIDAFYEGFLIIVLTLTVFTLLPGVSLNPAVSVAATVFTSVAGYLIARRVSETILSPEPPYMAAADLAVVATALLALTGLQGLVLHTALALTLHAFLRERVRASQGVEAEAVLLAEEAVSGLALGVPVDASLTAGFYSSRNLVHKLLGIAMLNGFNASTMADTLPLPPLARRLITLLSTPLEYSGFPRALASTVSRFSRHIAQSRKWCGERSRLYLFYAVFTGLLLSFMAYMLKGFTGPPCQPPGAVAPLVYSSIVGSVAVASASGGGLMVSSVKKTGLALTLGWLAYLSLTIL